MAKWELRRLDICEGKNKVKGFGKCQESKAV